LQKSIWRWSYSPTEDSYLSLKAKLVKFKQQGSPVNTQRKDME